MKATLSTNQGSVLVVDDEPAARLSLQAILGEEFEVRVAASVPEAIAALEAAPVDAIVTDYQLGGQSGLDLAHVVRQRFPGVMVIVHTGHPDVPEVAGSESAWPVVRLIPKPADPGRLLRVVRGTVWLARMQQAAAHRATFEDGRAAHRYLGG